MQKDQEQGGNNNVKKKKKHVGCVPEKGSATG